MELVETPTGQITLVCSCGQNSFRIEFHKSESALLYEQAQIPPSSNPHPPSILVAVCVCGSGITIMQTEPLLPMREPKYAAWRPDNDWGDEVSDQLWWKMRGGMYG